MGELRQRADEIIKETSQKLMRYPFHKKEYYAYWLAQTYFFVKHSTRLLALASAKFSMDEQQLHLRFNDHIHEERSHELLLLKDLQGLGCDIKNFKELPETAAFYQAQYYWIWHISPTAFFGYILSLEIMAASIGPEIYKKIEEIFGSKCGYFLKLHFEEDVDHVESAFKELEKLKKEDAELILKNLEQSCCLYGLILDHLVEMSADSNRLAA